MSEPDEQERRVGCVVYAAKSTEDLRGSIATQVADCKAAIVARGGALAGSPHIDENFSAYKRSRGPGLRAAKDVAIEIARRDGMAELWVQHSDRLARGNGLHADHLAEVFFAMRRAGVRLRSVQDDSSLQDVIHVALMGERNTEDSRRKSEAVRAGKRRQFDRGERLGGPVPDGYIRTIEVVDGRVVSHYELDPVRAPIIRRLFELCEANLADATVARRLNAEGLRTGAGRPWIRRRVQDTATNPWYAGKIARGRSTPGAAVETQESSHPSLVSAECFHRLMRDRAGRDRATGSCRRPGRPNSRHLLAGLAVCASCGDRMWPTISTYRRKDGTQRRTYLCRHIKDGTGLCRQPAIDAEVVDAKVAAHLHELLLNFDQWSAERQHGSDTHLAALLAELERVRFQHAAMVRREAALVEDYARHVETDNALRADIAAEALARTRSEQAQLAESLLRLQNALDSSQSRDLAAAAATFIEDLAAAVGGALRGGAQLVEINTELRRYFSGFVLGALPDRRVAIYPLVARSAAEQRWLDLADLAKLESTWPGPEILVAGHEPVSLDGLLARMPTDAAASPAGSTSTAFRFPPVIAECATRAV